MGYARRRRRDDGGSGMMRSILRRQALRSSRVPIISTGIGDDCRHPLLDRSSMESLSGAADKSRRSAVADLREGRV